MGSCRGSVSPTSNAASRKAWDPDSIVPAFTVLIVQCHQLFYRALAALPACLLACLPARLLACSPACLLALGSCTNSYSQNEHTPQSAGMSSTQTEVDISSIIVVVK